MKRFTPTFTLDCFNHRTSNSVQCIDSLPRFLNLALQIHHVMNLYLELLPTFVWQRPKLFLCDLCFFIELPSLLPIVDVAEALLHVRNGDWFMCLLVANVPDSFSEGESSVSQHCSYVS